MKPEDVPAELAALACDAMFGTPPAPSDDWPTVRRALAAVLPEHEKQVRERLAGEIADEDRDPSSEYERGLIVAENIARGGA